LSMTALVQNKPNKSDPNPFLETFITNSDGHSKDPDPFDSLRALCL